MLSKSDMSNESSSSLLSLYFSLDFDPFFPFLVFSYALIICLFLSSARRVLSSLSLSASSLIRFSSSFSFIFMSSFAFSSRCSPVFFSNLR